MDNPLREFQDQITARLPAADRLHVLEAGCGSCGHVRIDRPTHVTGIDISEKQLARNTVLDEKIRGDLQTHPLPRDRFHLIICWDVLEHLPHPEGALHNFVDALRADGLLILAFPNVFSLKGLATKFTPHAVHVWGYRRLLGSRGAGTEDYGPFRTYLRLAMAPGAIRRFAARHQLRVEYLRVYESEMQQHLRQKSRLIEGAFQASRWTLRLLTLGRWDAALCDCFVLLRKPARPVNA